MNEVTDLKPNFKNVVSRAKREVQPGQPAIELLSEKFLRRCRLRREVSQQAINELVDVRTHARTL